MVDQLGSGLVVLRLGRVGRVRRARLRSHEADGCYGEVSPKLACYESERRRIGQIRRVGLGLLAVLLVALVRSAASTQAPAKVIRVSAERFAYTPSEIVVERGTTVEFHLTSEDTDHGFHIVGTEVNVKIPKRRRGETVVRYAAETAGRFTIECSRPCGAGHTAMQASLVVK